MNQTVAELHDQALAIMPDGASHDASDCSICIAQTGDANDDSASAEGETQEGQMSSITDTLSKETHDALVSKAVDDATAALRSENEALTVQVQGLSQTRDEAQHQVSTLEGEVTRLNGALDTTQVEAQTATARVAELELEVTSRDEAARLHEVAQIRAKEVRSLGLLPDDQIDEKASRWASLNDDDWSDRIDEWKAIKASAPAATDKASAVTGSGEGEKDPAQDEASAPSARRALLGLPQNA